MDKVAALQQKKFNLTIRLICVLSALSFPQICVCQVDTYAIRKSIETVLRKNNLKGAPYELKVTSINQHGRQTVLVINNYVEAAKRGGEGGKAKSIGIKSTAIGGSGGDANGGQGGRGGNAEAVNGGTAIGGRGGKGGIGTGGQGGSAYCVNGGRYLGGDGGNSNTADGRGGRRTISACERANMPTELWKYGYGGHGADLPEYNRRLSILTTLREEYVVAFPDDKKYIDAGVDIVPLNWINKRLEEINENWRIEIDHELGGYKMPALIK